MADQPDQCVLARTEEAPTMEDPIEQQQQHKPEQPEESERPEQPEQQQTPQHGPYRGHESCSSAETTFTTISTAPTTPDSRPADADDYDLGAETPKMAHNSMVTVRLSEPPTLTLDTSIAQSPGRAPRPATLRESMVGRRGQVGEAAGRPTLDPAPVFESSGPKEAGPETPTDVAVSRDTLVSTAKEPETAPGKSLADELDDSTQAEDQTETASPTLDSSETDASDQEEEEDEEEEEVDWDQLQKSEDQATKNEETDNSTAMLLARLEKENAKIATNPKSIKVRTVERLVKQARQTRPPSMAQLKDMVTGPPPPALRYSMLPPRAMTDLEFWAALVKDYPQTAARLPTLLCNKIRKGIPPPLRGVVWQSMSGARDTRLEQQFERLTGESSPHEPVIIKDLSRTFPGVDMFHDAEGDGQRMLGRVLKCYSIFDPDIGYCQGLAFLVGPLLMHMPDKAAFCVLVRLMERYDLRSCFLPDLPGLHVRIYQFRELLKQMLPELSAHLDELQVDPAYVSQWFLSFFAVTAPLPILFRIYDVIFAEGASESLMRVALALMRKNQKRLLECTELEDAMTLLLSRSLWDSYRFDADEFVHDSVSLTGVVSREQLHQLERDYRESQQQSTTSPNANANAALASAITSAASRFLGRIWASSAGNLPSPRIGMGFSTATIAATITNSPAPAQASTPSSTLSPSINAPPSRPFSMLQRTASKQSLASTLNSMEASSVSVLSRTSTVATSRDSSAVPDDDAPAPTSHPGNGKNSEDKYLHSQIEDLLAALRELQRNQAVLADDLQREREEREEDRKVARGLLAKLRKKDTGSGSLSDDEPTPRIGYAPSEGVGLGISVEYKLADILGVAERRFGAPGGESRPSTPAHSKIQLQEELEKARGQVATAMSQSQDLNRKIHDLDQNVSSLKDQLRESHVRVRALHQEKQRLEKQVRSMRVRASAASENTAVSDASERPVSTTSSNGLREFKLCRSKSSSSNALPYGRRPSSTARYDNTLDVPTSPTFGPPPTHQEHEMLLSELVQAKTAEAVAKQEAEETKQKFEAFKKAHAHALAVADHGSNHTSVMSATSNSNQPAAQPNNAQAGGFWGAWRR